MDPETRGLLYILLYLCTYNVYDPVRNAIDAGTQKKFLQFFRPQPGCHLPNSPWPGII